MNFINFSNDFVIIIIRRDSDNSTNKYFAIISFREIFFYGKLFK